MSAEVANIALNAFPSQRPPRTKRGGERRRYIKSKKKFIAVAGQCADSDRPADSGSSTSIGDEGSLKSCLRRGIARDVVRVQ